MWGDFGDIAEFLYTCKIGIAPCVVSGGPGTTPGQLQGSGPTAFGSQPVGSTSAALTLTLSNIGSGTVTVSGVASDNAAEFPITGNTCTVLSQATSCDVTIAFHPSATGARTATITVTSDGLYSPQTFTFTGTGTTASNLQGLWWVPGGGENFWGINFAHQGDSIFATWYTYDTTGKAWWLTMLANRMPDSTYKGKISVSSGPPFNNFNHPGTSSDAGTGTLAFTDANSGTFDYKVYAGVGGSAGEVTQHKIIARFDLGTGPQPACAYSATANPVAATNYQDLWWVPTESGWGVNFAHQGDGIFLTWFTFDVDGTPMWLSAFLQRVATSNQFKGDLLRTSGPRFDDYKSSDLKPNQTVGTATVTFADGNHAKFDYAITAGLPAASQSKQITRFQFAVPGTVCQ